MALNYILKSFQRKVTEDAQEAIFTTLPTKLLELQALLDSKDLFNSPTYTVNTDVTVYPPPESYLEDAEATTPARKRKRGAETSDATKPSENLSLPKDMACRYPQRIVANSRLSEILDLVRRECEEFVSTCDKVKLWINITMPKMEDGDNFGVQVQEEVLSELHRAHEAAYNMRDSIRLHYISRGKLASKLCKYPHVEDYAIALKEHDMKQFYIARQDIYELRNLHAVLTDLLHKNIAKIRAPKGNNGGLMY